MGAVVSGERIPKPAETGSNTGLEDSAGGTITTGGMRPERSERQDEADVFSNSSGREEVPRSGGDDWQEEADAFLNARL